MGRGMADTSICKQHDCAITSALAVAAAWGGTVAYDQTKLTTKLRQAKPNTLPELYRVEKERPVWNLINPFRRSTLVRFLSGWGYFRDSVLVETHEQAQRDNHTELANAIRKTLLHIAETNDDIHYKASALLVLDPNAPDDQELIRRLSRNFDKTTHTGKFAIGFDYEHGTAQVQHHPKTLAQLYKRLAIGHSLDGRYTLAQEDLLFFKILNRAPGETISRLFERSKINTLNSFENVWLPWEEDLSGHGTQSARFKNLAVYCDFIERYQALKTLAAQKQVHFILVIENPDQTIENCDFLKADEDRLAKLPDPKKTQQTNDHDNDNDDNEPPKEIGFITFVRILPGLVGVLGASQPNTPFWQKEFFLDPALVTTDGFSTAILPQKKLWRVVSLNRNTETRVSVADLMGRTPTGSAPSLAPPETPFPFANRSALASMIAVGALNIAAIDTTSPALQKNTQVMNSVIGIPMLGASLFAAPITLTLGGGGGYVGYHGTKYLAQNNGYDPESTAVKRIATANAMSASLLSGWIATKVVGEKTITQYSGVGLLRWLGADKLAATLAAGAQSVFDAMPVINVATISFAGIVIANENTMSHLTPEEQKAFLRGYAYASMPH